MYYLYRCYEEIHGTNAVVRVIHIVVVDRALITNDDVSITVIEIVGGQNAAYPNIY